MHGLGQIQRMNREAMEDRPKVREQSSLVAEPSDDEQEEGPNVT